MENTLVFFIFLILLFGMFYFLIIRPQRKRQQRHQELMDALQPGDKIITIGGIHGQIESMTEETLPTRAEVTDVANATLEEATHLMLSAETAIGRHPHRVVDMMNKIIKYTEDYKRCEVDFP